MQQFKDLIQSSSHLLITAGAGMSADSGLPTFRDKNGFWEHYPFLKDLKIDFEQIANPQTFFQYPELAWAFYGHRFLLYKNTAPHNGYQHLLNLAQSKKSHFVITSNVDGHFQKAGFSQKSVYEIHGNINFLQCRCSEKIWSLDHFDFLEDFKPRALPKCPFCGAIARPNIVMFNDWDFNDDRTNLQAQHFLEWKRSLNQEELLLIIEIGAGIAIPSIRTIGEKLFRAYPNAKFIRINPQDHLIEGGISLKMGALEAINML